MNWRPRSLFQLLLLGFVTVFAPLTVTVAYSVNALEALATDNNRINQQVISLTRGSQILQSEMLDLERSARQYLTLEESALLDLYVEQWQRMQNRLSSLQQVLTASDADSTPLIAELEKWKNTLLTMSASQAEPLESSQLSGFDRLSETNQSLQRSVQTYVDQVLAQQQQDSAEIRQSLTWMVSLVIVITLIFGAFFIIWITRPISQLNREIELLGRGERQRQMHISGPREMRQLGEQLHWLQEKLNELEQEKQRFFRHMSHELKTPLASLREGSDLMAEGIAGPVTEQQREIVEILQDNSLELQRLVENLLSQNQLLALATTPPEPVVIDQLVQDLLRSHRIAIERRKLKVSLKGESITWKIDKGKLMSALENLVSNAVNYSPERGQIEIHWYQQESGLIIEVVNSGKPIPEAERDKIFEPFYQGSTERQGPIKGSGIGLSVAKECMKRMGGDLRLINQSDWPVCFRLQCPQIG